MKTIYITEGQKNIIKENFLLTEAKGDKALKKYIAKYVNEHLKCYLDTPLSELPPGLIQALNPGEGESDTFSTVKNNQNGCNRFSDFLRLNFCNDFGMTRNGPNKEYLEGVARIALGELGYYSFDENLLQGANAIKMARYVKIYAKHPELAQKYGLSLDEDLNGFSYNELISYLQPLVDDYISNTQNELKSRVYETPSGYRIVEIKDIPSSEGRTPCAKLTRESYNYLSSLEPYADWCILGNRHGGMYEQYTCGGGKFYICEKEGFRDIPRIQGENCPVDEYGLSLISVLVATDGLPEKITTRWNHDYGGEDHEELENAIQLQDLLKVNYLDIFKPRTERELRILHLNENKKKPAAQDPVKKKEVNSQILDNITACGMLVEENGASPNSDNYTIGIADGDKSISPDYHTSINEEESKESFKKYFNQIAKFMDENGLKVSPFPKIKLDWSEQDGLFIKTGYYTPEDKTVTIFCKDRHPKDILRSFAHEMVHHAQNLKGVDLGFDSNDDVKDNKRLEKIESEAYLKGNIFFRKWTEYANSKKKSLNESKTILNDEGEVVPDKCTCGGKIGTYICGEPIYKCTKCGKYYGTVKFGLDESKLFDEINPEDVDLSSFNIKRELNPKFWKNNLLDSRIRMKLMDIADDFIEFLGVDWVKPDDVIMTGSLANYNWNKKYSDIDLHVLMDFSKVDKRKDFVKKYFDSLKNQWNETHEDLKIFGFPVEVYVQDTNEVHTSTGVYSIDKNKWVTKPERETLSKTKVNKKTIKSKVANYVNKIDELVNEFKESENDDYKLRKISEKANTLFDEIKNERKSSLNGKNKKQNEITPGNIIFKCLRRLNYLDKLYDLKTKTYDKMNSLP